MSMAGVEPIGLDRFRLHHAYGDETIWNGHEYVNRHGEMAVRVVKDIVRSRVARASHGKPTAEPLERTALRLYKRAGRPELNARYAHIRKRLCYHARQRLKIFGGWNVQPPPLWKEENKQCVSL